MKILKIAIYLLSISFSLNSMATPPTPLKIEYQTEVEVCGVVKNLTFIQGNIANYHTLNILLESKDKKKELLSFTASMGFDPFALTTSLQRKISVCIKIYNKYALTGSMLPSGYYIESITAN